MQQGTRTQRGRGPVALAELVGRALDPMTARRGFATADLIAGWAGIVGARYAEVSRPERIVWPRGTANNAKPGTLIVVVEGPRALLFQHEADQIVERVNSFLGHGTVAKVKIVQGIVTRHSPAAAPRPAPLDAGDAAKVGQVLADVESDELRLALDRLGRAILADRNKKS